MRPVDRIRQLKEQFQSELSAETDKAKRMELAKWINLLFFLIGDN